MPELLSACSKGTGLDLQRCTLEAVKRVDVRLLLQQPLGHFVGALACCQVQRRPFIIIAALGVGDLHGVANVL